jgi:hypothetical protein
LQQVSLLPRLITPFILIHIAPLNTKTFHGRFCAANRTAFTEKPNRRKRRKAFFTPKRLDPQGFLGKMPRDSHPLPAAVGFSLY